MTHPTPLPAVYADVAALEEALSHVEFHANGLCSYDPTDWEYEAHPERIRRILTALTAAQARVEAVETLLWDDHPECCGNPVVGAMYMDQIEMVCCGCAEPVLLNDAQIVATLRQQFPEKKPPADTAIGGKGA